MTHLSQNRVKYERTYVSEKGQASVEFLYYLTGLQHPKKAPASFSNNNSNNNNNNNHIFVQYSRANPGEYQFCPQIPNSTLSKVTGLDNRHLIPSKDRHLSSRHQLQSGSKGPTGLLSNSKQGPFPGNACDVDHSPTSSAEVKNAWSCTSPPPYIYTV